MTQSDKHSGIAMSSGVLKFLLGACVRRHSVCARGRERLLSTFSAQLFSVSSLHRGEASNKDKVPRPSDPRSQLFTQLALICHFPESETSHVL